MKKFFPFILLTVGALVLLVVFFFVRGQRKEKPVASEEETALLNVALEDRPVVSLTPTSDGHYLKLKIEKITIPASSLDYELLYKNAQGVTQGVPGTVDLKGRDGFEADLLLGSESSGKFRYDEGVEEGTLSLRFRNDEGKLLAKFESEFHMQSGVDTLTSLDGNLTAQTRKISKGSYFITMHTIGVPGSKSLDFVSGPYGVFASEEFTFKSQSLKEGAIYWWNESQSGWSNAQVENLDSVIFVGISGNPQG